MSEVESTLDRIKSHPGVEGVLIVTADGLPLRPSKAAKARSVIRDLDPQNDLTFLRIRSKKHEIMIAPDKEYLLVVIQDPTVSNKK